MRLILSFLAAAVLTAPMAAPSPAKALDVMPPEAVAVDALVKAEMQDRGIPGLQIAVVREGRIVLSRSYGLANLQTPVPVTEDTVFSINSITKAFTGVEAMRLVEQGKLDLAAPVSTYLDDLPEAWRKVTIRQLLSHMSGFPNVIDNATGKVVGDGTEAGAWTVVTTQPMHFAPGEKFDYNQTNYLLLQRIIEKLEGRPYVQVVAERQFAVADMPHSGFGDSRDVIPGKSQSYRFNRAAGSAPGVLQNVYEEFPPMRRSASGLNSTAEDMARWVIALQAGRILKPDSLPTLWTQTAFNNGAKGEWALGWTVINRPTHRAVGMTGGGRSAFYIYPQDDVAVVILTNLAGGYPEELIDQVAGAYVPAILKSGMPALRAELKTRGFDKAQAVVAELKRKDPRFEAPEADLNNWGYRLLSSGKAADGIEIFKLAVALYPKSANTYDSLADAYDRTGQSAPAIENYRRALALDPTNDHARKRLEKLGAAAAP